MSGSSERWEQLRGLGPWLRTRIRGQDHVLRPIVSVFERGEMGLANPERPKGAFLLCGPTGTGKTQTMAYAADYLFGSGQWLSFDMSEYQDEHAAQKWLGAGGTDPGLLGRALKRGYRLLLFDEVDKAHRLVLDLFLQMLWPGRITVATGETFSLRDYYLAFTCNLGGVESMRMEHSSFASVEQAVLRRVKTTLRPELVGRMDEKLVFARLSPAVQREICEFVIAEETARLKQLGYDLRVSPEALEYLVREGFDPHLGARPLKRTVGRCLEEAIVRRVFADQPAAGRVIFETSRRRLEIADEG